MVLLSSVYYENIKSWYYYLLSGVLYRYYTLLVICYRYNYTNRVFCTPLQHICPLDFCDAHNLGVTFLLKISVLYQAGKS